MVWICPIKGCNSRAGDDVSFFSFPKESQSKQLQSWISFSGLSKHSSKRICSKHFETSCFKDASAAKKLLKEGSVPTLSAEACQYLKSCCVPSCEATSDLQRLVKFPKEFDLRDRWLRAINFADSTNVKDKPFLRICVDHFAEPDELCLRYQEPTRFRDSKGNEVLLASCRLCHELFPEEKVYPSCESLLQALRIRQSPDDFTRAVCEECFVKVNVLTNIRKAAFVKEINYIQLQNIVAQLKPEETVPRIEGEADDSEEKEELDGSDAKLEEDRGKSTEEAKEFPKPLILKRKRETVQHTPKRPKNSISMWTLKNKKCYICKIELKDGTELVEHQTKYHFSESGHTCRECNDGKVYREVIWYNNHLSYHDPERPLKCNFCPIRYCSTNSLKVHENKKHGTKHELRTESGQRFSQCDICGKMISSSYRLQRHKLQVHERKNDYQCKICLKTFFTSASATKHMTKHTKQYAYKCDLCEKRFRDSSGLSHHVAGEHEGKRPYKCGTCSKEFQTNGEYVHHRSTVHRNNRIYKFTCRLCKEIPQSRAELEDHITRFHPGVEYPRGECAICGKRFLTACDLTLHGKLHEEKSSDGERFQCEHCEKSYAKKVYLGQHVKMAHPDVWAQQDHSRRSKYAA